MGLLKTLLKKQSAEKSNIVEKSQPVIVQTITSPTPQRGMVQCHKVQIDSKTVESLKNRYISFDVETTGLNPYGNQIIEVGAVLFENGEITKQYSTLINPGVSIPQAATAINHITNDMIITAPREIDVYPSLVQFLGDTLNSQTAICAHNAKFDLDFLSQTLMRLGYNGTICYVDTLSLSRKLVRGLDNYKQDTVALHFGIYNTESHRAVSDATVCGKILWELLKLETEAHEQVKRQIEKSKPTDEELEVCAYIQDAIVKNGGDSEWLRFYKNSSNYVDVSYCYSMLRFKFAKTGKYIIVEQNAINGFDLDTEICTESEGGTKYIRVYFNTPFDLEPLVKYFLDTHKNCWKSALEYVGYGDSYKQSVLDNISTRVSLSLNDVASLLRSADRRRANIPTEAAERKTVERNVLIDRSEITINPIHNRVPLTSIRNLGNWDKGFDDGFDFYNEGEILRKTGNIEKAIILFDKARYNGYEAPALYNAYAMAFRQLKDYANEIAILDEALERATNTSYGSVRGSGFESRRNKAIQLLLKQQESQKNALEKVLKAQKKAEDKKITAEKMPKAPRGRAIIQMSSNMTIIKEFVSISKAVQETGINSKSIRDAANGVQKHAGGFVWKYAIEKEPVMAASHN